MFALACSAVRGTVVSPASRVGNGAPTKQKTKEIISNETHSNTIKCDALSLA